MKEITSYLTSRPRSHLRAHIREIDGGGGEFRKKSRQPHSLDRASRVALINRNKKGKNHGNFLAPDRAGSQIFARAVEKNAFSAYVTSHLTKPFKWGENDCCTFIGNWLEITAGRDYLTEHRPWKTAREATKKLRDLGGLPVLFQKHLNLINPNMAQDGDLTIYQGTAHLFSGRHIVSVGKAGLVFTDRALSKEAWTCRQ